MPFAEHFMTSGTFTLGSSFPQTVNVNCGFQPTKIMITDETQFGVGSSAFLQNAFWDSTNPTQTNVTYAASSSTLYNAAVTTNGISVYNGGAASPNPYALGPKVTGSSYVKSTGVFTLSSNSTFYVGATVLLTGFTVDKQLGGMLVTVSALSSTTGITIANSGNWLNTSSFTGGSQTFYAQLVTTPYLYYPQNSQVVYISAANPAVVTTSTNMNLSVGQQVRLYVPKAFGMTQANFTTAVISAVSGNQVTLGGASAASGGGFGVSNGLNSTGFTAFTWPTVSGVPFTPAYMVPIGSGPYPVTTGNYNEDTLQDATINTAFNGFTVGTNILQTTGTFIVAASDVISWTAWRGDV
jgi:hypothetical protein